MSPTSYYLINHTKKEFCGFNTDIPVFEMLELALKTYINWKDSDNIRIDSEWSSNSCFLMEHLMNNLNYRDVESKNNTR